MRGVTFSNFAAKKFDSQKVDHGPTLSLRIFIRFARKNSPSGNQPLVECNEWHREIQIVDFG